LRRRLVGTVEAVRLGLQAREEFVVRTRIVTGGALLFAAGFLLLVAPAGAVEIKVMSSAGFKADYLEHSFDFEFTNRRRRPLCVVVARFDTMAQMPKEEPRSL
jgi:hypothetical protein